VDVPSTKLPKPEPRPGWQIALAITLLLRMVYSAVAAVVALFVQADARLMQTNAFTLNQPASSGFHYALLGIWQRFDTLWYLRIAERGYDVPAAVVFYPLYPFLIRNVAAIVGPVGAALLISTLSAFFYFWSLLHLARNEFPHVPPLRVVTLAAVWPASFFFFAGYTEALAVALIVWSVNSARDERWLPAAACAFLAGLTRSAGVLVIVPLVIMAWRSRLPIRWAVAISPLGTIGYWFWLHLTGRPSVAEAYQMYWNTEVAMPWSTLWQTIQSLALHFEPLVIASLGALFFFFVAGVVAHRRLEDRCFSVAVILHILLRMCWPPLLGAPRYLLPVYPAYLTLGDWVKRLDRTRFVFLCAALFSFNMAWLWAFLSWSLVL
jgi:hypothetical protein